MARIVIPLNEAIHILTANVDLGNIISRIDATEQGPRLTIRLTPITRAFVIMIRFIGFENAVAWFVLDGVPTFVNLNAILKLPDGISVSGTKLKINTDVLIRSQLNVKGLTVQSVVWQNGAFIIDTGVN
jgi:hypothetical protein